jgi:hypothetical protein
VLDFIHEQGFQSLSHFLDIFFLLPAQHEYGDPHSQQYIRSVSSFLTGNDTFNACHLIERLYNHPSSQLGYSSARKEERQLAFSLTTTHIHYARLVLSSWALRLVGEKIYKEVRILTKVRIGAEGNLSRLRVGTKGWGKKTRIVT